MADSQAVAIPAGSVLATMDNPPEHVLREAQRAAAVLKDVISAKPNKVVLNNEQYLEFEDWQTLARFYGITAKEDGTAEFVEIDGVKGFRASAVALRHGDVISKATQYCMRDEEKWGTRPKYEYAYVLKGGGHSVEDPGRDKIIWEENPKKPGSKRPRKARVKVGDETVPLYQLASMAQTRANAKVLRNVLSWVAVLAGYKPTPAEELPGPSSGPQESGIIDVEPDSPTGVSGAPEGPPESSASGVPPAGELPNAGHVAALKDWLDEIATSSPRQLKARWDTLSQPNVKANFSAEEWKQLEEAKAKREAELKA